MPLVYGDLHIHIGRTSKNTPVKITASPQLTLSNIVKTARDQKGLRLIGLVDAACSKVFLDLLILYREGKLLPIEGGGVELDGLTIFFGSEVEITHKSGKAAHFLAYFPDLASLEQYAKQLTSWVTNPALSTQRIKVDADSWLETVVDLGGVALAAHAFTPHKGVYGSCVRSLHEMFERPQLIKGLELGLSADVKMAEKISDTHHYAYIANSDAHSLATIGREFTVYEFHSISLGTGVIPSNPYALA